MVFAAVALILYMASALEWLKNATPWFVKIPAKIALSRLPIRGRQWQRVHLFRAGTMDSPREALAIFRKLFAATGLPTLSGKTVAELGPGNSALTALIAASYGASRSWLIDTEPLASQDVSLFARTEQMLAELGMPVPGVGSAASMEAALGKLQGTYMTDGLASLKQIPDGAIDFLFSNAVLEHVRLCEFGATVAEMRRILKPNGAASHQIDFRDHLQGALNHLRFSERAWEGRLMSRSGFYTNRIPWPQMRKRFADAGFAVEVAASQPWPAGIPTPQRKMARPFRDMPPADLMTMGVHAVLRQLS
jgi:methyltransferase family protein